MPSYLDFDSTRRFRDFILGRTLNVPNGPQTFTSSNYQVQNLNDMSNVDPGAVDTDRANDLLRIQNSNTFKPLEYSIRENINTIPRRANLSLYYSNTPYFTPENHNLFGIMTNDKYDTESELFKFAASYIRDKTQKGPVYARIQQNLEASTVGRVRILDALEGNTATLSNIITGREPLVESNNKITVAKTIAGKGIDFLQTTLGLEFPWSEIPGDYLTNPLNPINVRPVPNTEFGKVLQDATGVLGSLIGIQRRPKLSRKPSDLFIEYMGSGQKQNLYDLLSYSSYRPDYTTTARSQQSSKIFSFVDKIGQGVKTLLGTEAPKGNVYIGDDRGNDVKFAMSDFNDRPVRSSYYLSLMFDPVQTQLFQRKKNITDGGEISGKITWISRNSRNTLGANNEQYDDQRSQLEESLSTKYGFRPDSLLGYTQDILDSMPKDGGEARSHVANVIDQTSRIFREGDVYLSRGSAIQYVNKFGEESGVEFCRTWTKDRPYISYSDTMKKGGNIRKFDASVMTDPWNLNIGPMSNGKKDFTNSSNIFENYPFGPDKDGKSFYAKKYMFSIENLAWKASNRPGFTVLDLPYCERGPNGGRVMWFPPYDLKVNETNSARWESNTFLGRPEPIYTYQNTERSGTVSFKVVVDHPSILNLLVRDYFKDMSDEEADNFINAFFAGCEELDFYDLIRRFSTLDKSDIEYIDQYLNEGGDPEVIKKYKTVVDPVTNPQPEPPKTESGNPKPNSKGGKINLKFNNDIPKPDLGTEAASDYKTLYSDYIKQKDFFGTQLASNLTVLLGISNNDKTAKKDKINIFGTENPTGSAPTLVQEQVDKIKGYFNTLQSEYTEYEKNVDELKSAISGKTTQNIRVDLFSSTSSIATVEYNKKLSLRRSYSALLDFFNKISNNGAKPPKISWPKENEIASLKNIVVQKTYKLSDFGWEGNEGTVEVVAVNYGENYTGTTSNSGDTNCLNRDFYKVNNLNIVAPISFFCRQTTLNFKYDKQDKPIPPPPTPPPPVLIPQTRIEEDGEIIIKPPIKKPPIDVMKRIIMKTLSECYYFKKLEEDSPVAFKSLREKLRYFHPGFHSTTPEGLNARLTFLHQCIRPGDTIPIKGVSDTSDLNARNTTFGAPPICVLRIGDFYHSKIVIRDVSISYDDNVWDLNPEGIGVQPMIANVQLQVSFIGGQGIEAPVDKLQNALSSNFYANTEMYDERSISTNQKIGGVDAQTFTKKFLEELQNDANKQLNLTPDDKNNKVTDGKYIGELNVNDKVLDYTKLLDGGDGIYDKVDNYFSAFTKTYNVLITKYGNKIGSLLFYSNYRTIKTYDVYTATSPTPGTTIELFGLPKKGFEMPFLVRGLKTAMMTTLDSSDPCVMFGFDKELTTHKIPRANELLKPYLTKTIETILNELVEKQTITDFEKTRNSLISTLDKLNFVVKYGKDFKMNGVKGYEATLSGFTANLLYNEYDDCINYISTNHSKFYDDLDNSINFINPVITSNDLSDLLSVLLQDKKTEIIKLFESDMTIFDERTRNNLSKRLDKFIVIPKEKNFKFKKFKKRKNNKEIKFSINTETEVTSGTIIEDAKKINSSKVSVTEKLNFYK
jgi:hypothetical protein